MAVVENERAKIMWDIEFHLPREPQNNANKIDMAINDKKRQVWLLLEGTVCTVGKIKERSTFKQDKYHELRSGIKQLYPNHQISQVNIVFDFLSNYHHNLKAEIIENITASLGEAHYLLLKSQKWIASRNR